MNEVGQSAQPTAQPSWLQAALSDPMFAARLSALLLVDNTVRGVIAGNSRRVADPDSSPADGVLEHCVAVLQAISQLMLQQTDEPAGEPRHRELQISGFAKWRVIAMVATALLMTVDFSLRDATDEERVVARLKRLEQLYGAAAPTGVPVDSLQAYADLLEGLMHSDAIELPSGDSRPTYRVDDDIAGLYIHIVRALGLGISEASAALDVLPQYLMDRLDNRLYSTAW